MKNEKWKMMNGKLVGCVANCRGFSKVTGRIRKPTLLDKELQ
jgi:hypothetical protein